MGKPPRRKPRSAKKSRRPANVEEAVERIRKFVVQLFIRDDGEGVDWSIIAEALLKAGFHALDRLGKNPRVYTLLRRVEKGVYARLTVVWAERFYADPIDAGPPPSAPVWDLEGPEAHFGDMTQ